jgi:hypothetical protein
MIGRIIGALVGGEIQRNRGRSGMGGALAGAVAMGAMRRMGPFGMLLGGAYVAKKVLDRRREGRTPAGY